MRALKAKQKVVYINAVGAFSINLKTVSSAWRKYGSVFQIYREETRQTSQRSEPLNICPWIDLGFLYFRSSIPPLFTHGAAGA